MNKIKTSIALLLLLGINMLFAQNMPLSVHRQMTPASQNSTIVTVEFRLPTAIQQGLVLSFNNHAAQLVLTHCRVDGKEFWLKESSERPAGEQAVHWSLQKGDLILRFNAQALAAGRQLSFSVSDFTTAAVQGKISVFVLTNDGANPIKGRQLGEQTFLSETGQ